MRILLTGAAGFIGSHLTEHLLQKEAFVIGLDNLDNQYDPALKRRNVRLFQHQPNYQFLRGDIRDQSVVEAVLQQYECDTVIHLAAQTGVRPSVIDPALYFDVNVTGTLSLLEAMRKTGVRRLVMASSSSVYGDSIRVPFREDDCADRPLSPYAASKRSAELLSHTYHHLYGFQVACLRFFTVYGPRQRPNMAISQFTERILNRLPITLYGDGSTVREYTYIDDTISGIVQVLNTSRGFDVLNIGGLETVSLLKLVQLIEQSTGEKALIDWQPMQPGDVIQTSADLNRAYDQIAYAPSVSIEEGIPRFVNWYRQSVVRQPFG
ncbi:putative protein MJ1055 [Fibrisoma limi BUZ 3]|uniref:NAD-dependent epimerase/dehydratase domain-containing protein n=1 Tax=Fibrisoma limi BUZ 3 TaxID=1185876 RepID=I2GHY2_9BACT|nr:NAD-dependent epimerase/dehydratase family protein [Fibrisoma limi]CCH53507.1 putative protein MJ1055 [Fibrisoma limi BUZ 3]